MLFLWQQAGEIEGGFQQFVAQRIILINFRSRSDPTVHWPALHNHRFNTGHRECPGVVAFAKPYQHAVIASAAEEVPVQEPGPTAEHGFLGYTSHLGEIVVHDELTAQAAVRLPSHRGEVQHLVFVRGHGRRLRQEFLVDEHVALLVKAGG